jgi:ribonucleoside-triphosphate reductase
MHVPREPFALDASFLDRYRGRQPYWGPLGYLVYKRTYAGEKPDGSMEEFWETCQRVVEGVYQIQKGHCRQLNLPWSDSKAQRSAQEMFARMFAFKWLPPGRGLSKMGTDNMFKIGGACLNNCGFISTRNIGNHNIENAFAAPFVWLMNMSMVGVGVGFDTRGAGTVKLRKPTAKVPFVVEDSREGWCDYLRNLLQSLVDSATPFPVADYKLVRPKGSKINGFGGTASGPEALEQLTSRIRRLAELYGESVIDSRFIVDVANSVGECVVAGGVRRTAEIAFGHDEDDYFLKLKDFANNPEANEWPRWASNNSFIVDEHSNFEKLAAYTARNGEPGYLFLNNARKFGRMMDAPNDKDHRALGANPCVEQTLEDYELCCLVETFPSKCDDYEDYERTLKYAYLYAKTVTMVPTQSAETNAVMLRNRRIGCSQSGIQDNIAARGLREHLRWCDRGYNYIQKLDGIYSDWLCVPRSIKTTSVKPSGTISKLVGVREGIHESKGEYEYQTIRIDEGSQLLPVLAAANYRIVKDPKAPNTQVVYFPMHYAQTRKREPTMWEQLELAALMQYYWADNQVSVTVDFDKATEGPEIATALQMYAHRLKGLSFLPREDHGFEHAPKQVITKEEHDRYKAQLKPVDFSMLRGAHEAEDKFCDGGLCEIPTRKPSQEADEDDGA